MAFTISRKRVLVVGGEGVTLFGPTSRGIEREAALSWEVPNFDQQLVEALTEQHKSDPVLILFDGADQTYRKEENIPKLSPFDRARYIKRKLDQTFPSYPVRASVQVKPPQEQPFYLFVALPETDRLDHIAEDMLEAGVSLSGFGLLPAESVGLVKALASKVFGNEEKSSRWAVLISQHETGGLRQVVVKNGNLALTRITPTSEAGVQGPGWADEVMREFKATLTYIARFGYNAEEGLDVMVICSSIEKQFFSDKSLPVTNFQCLTPSEALALIGAKGASLGETNFGDVLHAAWVAKKGSLAVPVVVPSIQRIMVPRKAANLAALLLGVALIALGFIVSSQYNDYTTVRKEMLESQRQKELLDQEYAQDSKIFDAYPVKPPFIKSVLNVKQLIDDNTVNITPTLNVLRYSLDTDVKLSSLTFEHAAPNLFAPVKPARGVAPVVKKPGAPPDKGKVTIKFRFTFIGGLDLEHKVQRSENLQKELQQRFPGYTVKIATQFGAAQAGELKGEAGKTPDPAAGQDDSAEFEMTGPPL